jgi:diguanylate cyclase (GGDEF)-like protein
MASDYKIAGLLLILATLLSLLFAGATVRRVDRSVVDMNNAVTKFSLDNHTGKVTTPANTPFEFRPVFKQMRSKSKQLRNAYSRLNKSIEAGDNLRKELIQVIARKEAEIADRTAELEEANTKLSGLSREDALTGIANRREFAAVESRIWRNAARSKTPVALAMIDIDYFKIFNDTLGHHAGDECLRKVAQALHDCITRPLDVVARYGGEEFIAVMDGASIENALVLAERMRRAVFDLGVTHPGSAHSVVTVSIGVFSSIPGVNNDSDAAIKAADESLYYAKAAGRNCVVYSENGEYVTYEPTAVDTGTTNVIAILSGSAAQKLS